MKPKVYFTKEITPESLIKLYEALDIKLPGKVGVKVSTGEQGAKGYLKAELIGPFVQKLNRTIIESNTAYPALRGRILRKHTLRRRSCTHNRVDREKD